MNMRPVMPVEPVAPWLGGKSRLAKRLIERINAVPHSTYAEPFIGMGGVFLRRDMAAPVEVINDISGEVTNFFRVVQRHFDALAEAIKWQLTSRVEFERQLATPPLCLTDIERAARFLYLQRTAFGGKATGQTFGVSYGNPALFNAVQLRKTLADLHARLAGVMIECLNYSDFIARYDAPETLFYLDPPYFGGENDYGKGLFARADFAALAAQLACIKGGFILSINDTPEIRAAFAAFEFEEVKLKYSISNGDATDARELIIIPPGQAKRPDLFL